MSALRKVAFVCIIPMVFLMASGASIAATFCPPNVVNSNVHDDLVVNAFCIVYSATVHGDITVAPDGFLIITDTRITGDLKVQSSAIVSGQSVLVGGDVAGKNANYSTIVLTSSFVNGRDVYLSDTGSVIITDTAVAGDVKLLDNGFAIVSDSNIGGDLNCSGYVSTSGNVVGGDKLGTCAE